MTEKQELERERDRQRVINAYHRVFATEDGQTVLNNLRSYFRTHRPAFERSLHNSFCPLAAALRDGQREVVLFIEAKLSSPAQGDADQEQPKTAVIK
jgi:hypothetical protein